MVMQISQNIWLINQKYKIIMWNRDGHLLLSVAAIHGHTHIIKLLLELGSPHMDRENYLIESPLQIAVVQGDEVVIKSLIYPPNPQCYYPNSKQLAL
jgi:ankyrin repeat protein